MPPAMAVTEQEIERIVREVLARRTQQVSPAARQVARAGRAWGNGAWIAASTGVASAMPAAAEISIPERLITLASLPRRLAPGTRLQFVPGAVITPAARDYLREQGTVWRRGGEHAVSSAKVFASGARSLQAATPGAPAAGRAELLLAVAVDGFCPQALVSHLQRAGAVVEQIEPMAGVSMPAELANRALARRVPGALLCDSPVWAACAANRFRGIRSAAIRDERDLEIAFQELAANVLAIRPGDLPTFALQRALARLAQVGWAPCPAAWREALD